MSGETSAGGLRRLPELLARRSPRVVVIELGGNDGLRGLPRTHGREPGRDGAAGARRRRRAGAARYEDPAQLRSLYQRRFERVFAEVAKEQKLPFAAFLLEGLDFGDEHFQADGIHPTAAAQPVLLRNAWPPLARPQRYRTL